MPWVRAATSPSLESWHSFHQKGQAEFRQTPLQTARLSGRKAVQPQVIRQTCQHSGRKPVQLDAHPRLSSRMSHVAQPPAPLSQNGEAQAR